jgi:hypothetical protein
MTGNIVFLGFGIAEIEGPDVVPVIFAISMFARGPISVYGSRRNTPANLVRGPGNDGIARPHRDRRGCFPSRVVGSRRTSPDEVCDVLIVLFSLAMGDPDRNRSITRCARRFHHSWDVHAGRIRRYVRSCTHAAMPRYCRSRSRSWRSWRGGAWRVARRRRSIATAYRRSATGLGRGGTRAECRK